MDYSKGRKDCYFGFHLAFHPHRNDAVVEDPRGDSFYEWFLDETRPDYIQIDAKSWHGLSAVEIHNAPPASERFLEDTEHWMKAAATRGILVYGEYCFLSDTEAFIRHPEWAALNEEGKPYSADVATNAAARTPMSFFSPYYEECVLKQLKDYAKCGKYRGIWVDFGRWLQQPDYSEWARKAYEAAGHGAVLPRKGERDYADFLKFQYDQYTVHALRFVEEVHAIAPEFEICDSQTYLWNGLKTDQIGMDFFSTDLARNYYFLRARMKSRLLMEQKAPWDLMAWDHAFAEETGSKNMVPETASHLCQVAASAIACGGGFSIYTWPYRNIAADGHRHTAPAFAAEWQVKEWTQVRDFCKTREWFSYRAENIPQAAVVLSDLASNVNKATLHDMGNDNYHTCSGCGLLSAMMDRQYSAGFLFADALQMSDLSEYGVIAVPEALTLEAEAIDALKTYARNGGSLLVASPNTLSLFDLDEIIAGETTPAQNVFVKGEKHVGGMYTELTELVIDKKKTVISGTGCVTSGFEKGRDKWLPLAAVCSYGKGMICALAFDFGTRYTESLCPGMSEFFAMQMEMLFPKPKFTVTGSRYVDAQLMRKNNMMILHLINRAGDCNSSAMRTYDEIPQLRNLDITIECGSMPTSVFFEPEHCKAAYTYQEGTVSLRLDQLDIHTAIVISFHK